MSLSEEKMMVLKMLSEGKISSDEAARLIEALEVGNSQGRRESEGKQQKQANYTDEVLKMREKINDWRNEFKSNYNQKDFDRMIDEFSQKAEKLGKNVAVTTVGIVDKVVDFVSSFVDTNSFNMFGSCQVVERSFEAAAAEGMNIRIGALNGSIIVKKGTEDRIFIRTKVRSPVDSADSVLLFNAGADSVELEIKKTGSVSVAHEIILPAVKFGEIKLETTNGKIYVEDSMSDSFIALTRNSHIEMMGVNSSKVTAMTRNARIQLSYVIGKDIEISTTNSGIDVKHLKVAGLKASTSNGKILLENIQNCDGENDINLQLKTSNSVIKIAMDDWSNRGYRIKARTSAGGVNLLIPNIKYNSISKLGPAGNSVDAESEGYESFVNKVTVDAETTNGYIEIVK